MALTDNGIVTISGAPSGGEQPMQNAGATMVSGVIVPAAGFIGIGTSAAQIGSEVFGVQGSARVSNVLAVAGSTVGSEKLHVAGDGYFRSTGAKLITRPLADDGQTTGLNMMASSGAVVASVTTNTLTGEMRIGGTNAAYFMTLYSGNVERIRITTGGQVGIGLTPTANMAGLSIEAGLITLKERATPTADTNYGKIYTKTDNNLYFQDGAGVEHQVAFV